MDAIWLCKLAERGMLRASFVPPPATRELRDLTRIGKRRATVAVCRSLLTIIWHLLADPSETYNDLGPDYYTGHIDTARRTRRHIRELHDLDYRVTLEPVA